VGAAIVDPPRDGCPAPVLSAIFETVGPPRGVYVSCNPEALSRELPVIVRAGYQASLVQPIDMFPHTEHIETVVVLRRTARTRAAGA
jgi:23S rRNA (uracil1939-C5)-methyltransferase